MKAKFITVKGSERLGHEPFYVGVLQHERTMSRKEAYEYIAGQTGYTATAVDLLDSAGELWQTVPATYADGMLTAWLDFRERPSETGAVRVTTISGSATYEVVYENH